MHLELKKLTRHTAVYTFGNLIYRGASFILVPLYAHALSPAEYGKLELITVITYIVQALLSSGIAHSALRFYFESDKTEEQRSTVSSVFIASLAISIVGATILLALAPNLSRLMFGSTSFAPGFRLAAVTMVLEISREISLALVRAMERAGFFIIVSLTQLVAQTGVTLYTVVERKMGVMGALTGNFAASFLVWAILSGFTFYHCGFRFRWSLLVPVARYAAPLMLSSFGSSAFQYVDRFTLNTAATIEAVGIYALSVRISNLIPVLLVVPFTNSYGPFRFSIMKQANCREVYVRVLTYYTLVVAFITLAVTALSREVLMLFASREYQQAYVVVPLLLIPQALYGAQYCLQTGIYIEKKTKYMAYIAVSNSAVQVALVLGLIPLWGVTGAGVASLLSGIYGLIATYYFAQKVYPLRYEFDRLLKITGTALGLGLIAWQVRTEDVWYGIALKLMLLSAYPVILALLRCHTQEELQMLRDLWSRACGRLSLKAAV